MNGAREGGAGKRDSGEVAISAVTVLLRSVKRLNSPWRSLVPDFSASLLRT